MEPASLFCKASSQGIPKQRQYLEIRKEVSMENRKLDPLDEHFWALQHWVH